MKILSERYYDQLINPLKMVSINHLFARSVIERKITGKIFVDQMDHPKTFYVVHPYGMSLLFGDWQHVEFNKQFLAYSLNISGTRDKTEWMQAYPNEWDEVLSRLYGNSLLKSAENIEQRDSGIIELNTRVNFKFNKEKFNLNKTQKLPPNCEIVRTNKTIFQEMTGLVIPAHFWDTADDFVNNGVGFSLLFDNKLAATAYSAFIHDDKLELGIETITEFRGKGFAHVVCGSLIDHCINHGYEPVWACRQENTGSYRLAEKLGFEVACKIPYYKLNV